MEPFWWQRRSVQVLGALVLLTGLVALYRLLLQQLKASNLRLARRVDEATFDLQAKTVHLQALNQEKTELAERLARQAEAFERQAREDALTGLPNRRAFDETLPATSPVRSAVVIHCAWWCWISTTSRTSTTATATASAMPCWCRWRA